jgi:hypothetical protein
VFHSAPGSIVNSCVVADEKGFIYSIQIPHHGGAKKMELHDWLLWSRYVTKREYLQIVKQQIEGSLSDVEFDEHGFAKIDDAEVRGLNHGRRHPVGEVIDRMDLRRHVYHRAHVEDLPGLVFKWQSWHVDHLEPIANYSTASLFGKNLYVRHAEKKLVAWFVSKAHVRSGPIIRDGDTVVIPEGSSAFYVGLGIAAWRKRVSVITSNGPLYREYLDNPALANSFRDFHVIGGCADLDREHHRSERAGVFGFACQQAYKQAITTDPRATVVVMPVSGMLPDDGPYALDGESGGLKRSIILDSIGDAAEEKVREIIFVTDYSKHMRDESERYGSPIFERGTWRNMLERNHDRITLVAAPPPLMREALCAAEPVHPARRTLSDLGPEAGFSECDRKYNSTARAMGKMFHSNSRLMFHEAYAREDRTASALAMQTSCPA